MGYSNNVVVGADDIGRRFRELTPKGIKYSIIIGYIWSFYRCNMATN